jgi:hypothetical protein
MVSVIRRRGGVYKIDLPLGIRKDVVPEFVLIRAIRVNPVPPLLPLFAPVKEFDPFDFLSQVTKLPQ